MRHSKILLDRTKNGERRVIPINSTLRNTLKSLVRHINSPYVFVDSNGRRFKDVKRSFATALRRVGIKDFHFHDLRHTFASHLVMNGVDLATVKELMGHKNFAMTLRYAHLSQGHLRPIVITPLNTGMRKSEILSLEWERHVDMRHSKILLDRTKNGERRVIPINSTLRNTLKSLVRHINSPYVFVDSNGRRFKDVKRSFATALRRVGIKDFHFHDLRHTFASHLVMNGVDLATVKELMGHKNFAMTLRYAHLSQGHKVVAMENIYGNNPALSI